MTSALVGFIGVVVGLIAGFGYRFWATRRDELAQATVAVTVMRDELEQLMRTGVAPLDGRSMRWREQRTALITQLAPEDYVQLFNAVAAFEADPKGAGGECVAVALDRMVRIFWSEHQAFILSPLAKYIRRDDLIEKLSDAVRAALDESVNPCQQG